MTAGTVICDLDGVVYLGDQPIEGAGQALAALEEEGFALVFCTNNSWRTTAETAAKIARVTGYPARQEQVVSSAMAAASLVARDAERAFVVGGPGVVEALESVSVEVTGEWRSADTVVVGIDFALSYDRLSAAVQAVRAGARLVATNHDPTYPTDRGLMAGAGAVVAAVATGGGAEPTFAGKPFSPMRTLLARKAAVDGDVWLVGDRPDTDLAMAAAEGWRSVLVLTGVVTEPEGVEPPPSLVLSSIALLPVTLRDQRP